MTDPRGTWALNLGGTLNLLEAVKASGLKPRVILVGSGVCYGNPAPEHLPGQRGLPAPPEQPVRREQGRGRPAGHPALPGARHRRRDGPPVQPRRPAAVAALRPAALARQVAEVEAGQQAPRRGRQPRRRPRLHRRPRRRPRLPPARRARRRRRDLQPRLRPGHAARRRPRAPRRRWPGRPIEVHVDPARVRPVDQPLLVADPSKLRAATGWEPRFTIEQTLADMLQYWRNAVACGV